eukprot:1372744-Karenia_brevis.AAC.1
MKWKKSGAEWSKVWPRPRLMGRAEPIRNVIRAHGCQHSFPEVAAEGVDKGLPGVNFLSHH